MGGGGRRGASPSPSSPCGCPGAQPQRNPRRACLQSCTVQPVSGFSVCPMAAPPPPRCCWSLTCCCVRQELGSTGRPLPRRVGLRGACQSRMRQTWGLQAVNTPRAAPEQLYISRLSATSYHAHTQRVGTSVGTAFDYLRKHHQLHGRRRSPSQEQPRISVGTWQARGKRQGKGKGKEATALKCPSTSPSWWVVYVIF